MLFRGDDHVPLPPKMAELLLALVQAAGRAVAAMRLAVTHSRGSTEALAGLAQAHAVAGDRHDVERIVRELAEGGRRYVSPYNVARVYGAIDDRQRALEWLERAYREHNPDLIELTREPLSRGCILMRNSASW